MIKLQEPSVSEPRARAVKKQPLIEELTFNGKGGELKKLDPENNPYHRLVLDKILDVMESFSYFGSRGCGPVDVAVFNVMKRLDQYEKPQPIETIEEIAREEVGTLTGPVAWQTLTPRIPSSLINKKGTS
jgi:hypothetical protein